MKNFLLFAVGAAFWLSGLLFIFVAVVHAFDVPFFVALGRFGKGLAMAVIGLALMPGTIVQEFLKNTFSKR
jgi:hypothetical protein